MAVYDVSSIVISSRIRLARNLKDFAMPQQIKKDEGFSVLNKVVGSVKGLDDFKVYKIDSLPKEDAFVMQEKHLISLDLLEKKDYGAVILSSDETISIMVNEEDHIREQCFLRGLELEKAYEKLNSVDDKIISSLNIAFDNKLGFLTSCITNLGTGMRASVLMFLPALTLSGEIENITKALSEKGLCTRGVYGEASSFDGFMYQISNGTSLGLTEKEIVGAVKEAVLRICDYENRARKKLLLEREVEITDRVLRAYGILTNCYTLSSSELLRLGGELKMGIALGIIRLKDNGLLDKFATSCMKYNLFKIAGKNLDAEEEGLFRASYVSRMLKNQRIK
ncbi:MAG: ATP--guanido phosphotransferase [Clostridia bacterium]|nr:ATP--guanido phosphotransferase [Clostridia bacterium]